MGRYVAGQEVVIDFTFEAGDPTVTTARLHRPDGTETNLDVSPAAGDGTFSTTYLVTDDDPAGDYLVKIEGTGDVIGATLHVFHVDDDGFAA